MARSLRFGLQLFGAASRGEWEEQARRAGGLGFSAILVPDHVLDDVFPPLVALGAMASVTESLRVGTLVLNNDLRHPVLVARDAAAIDLLPDGRLELGNGCRARRTGVRGARDSFDPAATRV